MEKQKMEPKVKDVLNKLGSGLVKDGMYEVIREHENEFRRMGITLRDIKELLELKRKVAFLPDSFSYSLSRPGRGDYLIANCDSPTVTALDTNEIRFLSALRSYYMQENDYKQKMGELSQIANKYLEEEERENSTYYRLGENQELGLLTKILLNRDIEQFSYQSDHEQQLFLKKYDLYDAYHMDDDKVTLRWKAGEALESKGFLNKGYTEHVLKEVGVSVEELRENLYQYKIDCLRVSNVEILAEDKNGNKRIRCMVDEDYQSIRELSARDVKLSDKWDNRIYMAVKYYADVLEKNRKEHKMIADEKTLERVSMLHSDRLIDIYKHGMTEQDVMLSKASEHRDIDSLWQSTMVSGLEEYSVEDQKMIAFDRLVDYICGLRPGQLSDEEVVRLVEIPPLNSGPRGYEEKNLMELPEAFFPLVEESGKFERNIIDYVKVQRDIGRITPTIAYNSMCYFLSYRLKTEYDPTGADDEYGQVTGCDFYPYRDMKNPSEKFPPNLLNEMQWSALGSQRHGNAASFIPYTAFRKNRITGVQVYPLRNGDMNIRCIVDGEQQGGKRLSELDAKQCIDKKADLNELAVGYFIDAFARSGERENVILSR